MRLRSGVAPYNIIQQDFRELDNTETLRTTWNIERLILMQSVQGHAHEGHGKFHGTKYPNTSMDDISKSLSLDPAMVRKERQKLINEIYDYVERVLSGDDDAPLANKDGRGLLGSSIFHNMGVSGNDVLKGLYIGGARDETKVRFAMEDKYGVRIGGGKSFLVNTKVMNRMGLDGEILAHGEHEDLIDYYKQIGLIVAETGVDKGDLEYMYIRLRKGTGASDDTAIVAAGLLYGLGVAVGVFLSDAIDTLEKYVPLYYDQDAYLADRIAKAKPDLQIPFNELLRFVYIQAIQPDSGMPVPDSSLRYLLLVDRECDLTAIESHFLYIQRKRIPNLRIAHEGVPNRKFYEYVSRRVKSAPKLEPITLHRRSK